MNLPSDLLQRLDKDLRSREEERAHGFTMAGLHRSMKRLASRVSRLEHHARLPPLYGDEEDDRIPELDAAASRGVPAGASDRAAAISMSAPGLHAAFRGRAPTRFAMGFLLLVALAAGVVGYAVHPATASHPPATEGKP